MPCRGMRRMGCGLDKPSKKQTLTKVLALPQHAAESLLELLTFDFSLVNFDF
ncbi:hypothetical protein B0I21_101413 [Sphingobacterium paludis]|uniref:Uncharacterized protein n=1 Tax=Sphingobacterium paludis TaxID=1476465 RepID=A0A4R7DED8_9SPHI|nr:hypothetical protein B0I21_101413 [Sphingobacterium paludis]